MERLCQAPLGGPQQVLQYLGRYIHRVAIANSRLLGCENGRVRFRWKDYRADNKSKVMTLDADEFIRRFLLHVLPKGFRRIRHFGFLANACRAGKLPAIRAALRGQSRHPLLNPQIIASATQSLPVIVSICAQSVVAAWSRSAFGRARHRGAARHRAVTPHDASPRTRPFAHYCAVLRADAACRNVKTCSQNPVALARIAYLRPKPVRSSSHTQSPDLLIITVCPWLNRTGEQSIIEPPALISNAHKPQSITRGFVQSGFK